MNLKRLTVALASALFLVGPAGTALAAGGDVRVIPLVLHDPDHDGGENPGEGADDPGNPGAPGEAEEPPDVGDPGEHASDPRDREDSGDGAEDPRERLLYVGVQPGRVC